MVLKSEKHKGDNMFITKKDYRKLLERVQQLEKRSYEVPAMFILDSTKETHPMYLCSNPIQKVPLWKVIQKILDHLRLQLQYVDEIPATVDLIPLEKDCKKKCENN